MAPELDVYARLTENQLLNRAHPEEGMFIAESPKVIERALDAGCIPVSLLMETKHAQGEAKEMIERCGDIPVYTAEFDVLTKLTGFALTRGALCAMYRPKLQEPEQICAKARRIAVLENVQETRDGVLVLFHDSTLERIDGTRRTIRSLSWDELQQVDAGGWYSEQYSGTRIPKLDRR